MPRLLAEPEAAPGRSLTIQIPSWLFALSLWIIGVWIAFSIIYSFINQIEANRQERWNPQTSLNQ